MLNMYNALMDGGIVKEGHWKLTSGKHAKLYVNKDKIIINPILYPLIISRLSMLIREKFSVTEFDIVTGPAVAGINFSAPVSLHLGKISVYPEKVYGDVINGIYCPGDYAMVFRNIFKEIIKGKKVILIEDIITTGGSIVKTMKSIYDPGGEVTAVFSIWNRNPNKVYIKNLSSKQVIPIYSLVEKKVESWEKEYCPLCKEGIPLLDPKTDEVIEC